MTQAPYMTVPFIALLTGNVLVAVLLLATLGTYMIRYYWWRSETGRIVVASLCCMLSVISAGMFERFGHIVIHNILAAIGYWGASLVLLLSLRHIWKLTNAPGVAVPHRDVEPTAAPTTNP